MSRIQIDGVDVTEDVAAMYDALVASIAWGSGFLDVDTIVSIIRVGGLAGFDVTDGINELERLQEVESANEQWKRQAAARDAAVAEEEAKMLAEWNAQVEAMPARDRESIRAVEWWNAWCAMWRGISARCPLPSYGVAR